MKRTKLSDMVGGWFIGDFEPSLLKSKDFEVAVKNYKKGDYEESHHHKISTEYTVILNGNVKMNNIEQGPGSILTIHPMESTDFLALTDVTTVVVKVPSSKNDKYLD